MGETRINLKHLLEDIRDSYPFTVEEVIVTELVANALDSGASEINFLTDPAGPSISVIDNGCGMKRRELRNYHDIASTTKKRGKGIGFAGIGVKLALLIAKHVVTETKNGRYHGATSWHLKTPLKAPWERVSAAGVLAGQGTAVTIYSREDQTPLINPAFVKNTILNHFCPLMDRRFDPILKLVYKNGVHLKVNGEPIVAGNSKEIKSVNFLVRAQRQRIPAGIGFLAAVETDLEENFQGVAVSTYGKVIRRGWEWLGLAPRNPSRLTGMVEIPELASILGTNKADFLKDQTSLQKYYRYRKAIQSSLLPILQELGEELRTSPSDGASARPLQSDIRNVLGGLVGDFPELAGLFGWKATVGAEGVKNVPDGKAQAVLEIKEAPVPVGAEETVSPDDQTSPDNGREKEPPRPTRQRAALALLYADDPDRKELGWMVENNIYVNRRHPAFVKAQNLNQGNYHTAVVCAWVLSEYLDLEKSQRQFLSRFLEIWGSRS